MKLYNNVSIFFSIWLGGLVLVSFVGFSSMPHSGKFGSEFFKSLANWDGGHFLGIAEYGYSEKFQYAFFPLYPLVIRVLSQFTNNYLLAGILISVVASFLGLQLLYRIVKEDFDKQSLPIGKQSLPTGKKKAEQAVLTLLFFPTSFFLLTSYSEGLFFFLVVAGFYFLQKQRLYLAVIFAALASATRLAGLALAFSLIVQVWVTFGINRRNFFVLLAPAGFIIYCWYLYIQTGDPFYFVTAEANWQRSLSIPGLNFWETLRNLATGQNILQYPMNALDFLFAVFGLGFVIRSFRFLPLFFGLYGLISLLLPLFTSTLDSVPRFLLPIFPIFILIALLKSRYLIFSYQIISLMLLSLFAILFVGGYWVS